MGSPDHQMNPCAICQGSMVAGGGQAIFTAECTHTFHFGCFSDSVARGHHMCPLPLCKAQWRELPSALPAPPQPMDSAECMATARAAAERGAPQEAVTILENQKRATLRTGIAQIGDPMLVELGAELLKMRRRMRALTGQQSYYTNAPPAYMAAARMSTPTAQPRAPMQTARMSSRMSVPSMQVARMRAPTQRRASSRQKQQPSTAVGSGSLTRAGVKKWKGPNTRSQGCDSPQFFYFAPEYRKLLEEKKVKYW